MVSTLNPTTNKICLMLIGLPGVGKSTFINQRVMSETSRWYDYMIISSDQVIEDIAARFNSTYSEVFLDIIGFAEKMFWKDLETFAKENDNLIIDRTNLNSKSRKKIIDFLKPFGYEFIAYDFQTPPDEEWQARLKSRPGKVIPAEVLQKMKNSYEVPLVHEGFTEIVSVPAI